MFKEPSLQTARVARGAGIGLLVSGLQCGKVALRRVQASGFGRYADPVNLRTRDASGLAGSLVGQPLGAQKVLTVGDEMRVLAGLWLVVGCSGDEAQTKASAEWTGVRAIVSSARAEHFFDTPFPDDAYLDDLGHPILDGFPEAQADPIRGVVQGWADRLESTAVGFGNNSAAYFRFEDALALPTATDGTPSDPVLLVDLETGELLPLTIRFVADPKGDPFYAPNTLALAPQLGHPPRSGATLAAVVTEAAGAAPPAGGYTTPDALANALRRAGVTSRVAVATTFTVQDSRGQLVALLEDIDSRLGAAPDWSSVELRQVVGLEYAQDTTPSGEDGTRCTATFADGSSEDAWLAALEGGAGDHDHDLANDWPMRVFQAELPVLNYSGLDDRPYMSPGVLHISDTARTSGWIQFDGGELTSTPDMDATRITVSMPFDGDGRALENAPVLIYDHGTGGHAYNAVQRRNKNDLGASLAARYAAAGWVVVGRDAPLYGTRYPLIDEGYSGGSLGFYNIVNLPAFRDNQRQAAIEGHIVRRFVETGLNDVLPEGSVDTTRIRRLGHSMGSVTTNLGIAGDPAGWEATFLSGTGGVFAHYFLDTGLLADFDNDLIATLFQLFGAAVPEPVTTEAVLGAALGLDEPAWAHLDRLHPVMTLFQWTMDPSDPMAVARAAETPALVFIGDGDLQVPNFTSEALAEALPAAQVAWCSALDDYDPHYCLHREEDGMDVLSDWLSQ